MRAAIRAEFRKLFSIRSTYVFIGVCLAITIFYAFYIMGVRAEYNDSANPHVLANSITGTAQFIGLFIALVGTLLVTHEYRYNTILHTLTANRRRWYVLASKIIVVTSFVVGLTLLVCAAAPLLTRLGLQTHHINLAPQNIPFVDLLGRSVFYCWGYDMLALGLAFTLRSQVGAIITLLLFPSLVETLLALILKDNAKYLPFNALSQVISQYSIGSASTQALNHGQAAFVVVGYVVAGWLASLVLLSERDAN